MDYLNKIAFPICHKCQSSLNFSNINNSINLNCKCNTSTIPISVYYSLFNNNLCKCSQHNNKQYNHFCIACLSYICDDCLQLHQSHYIMKLSNESSSFFSNWKIIHTVNWFKSCKTFLLLNDGRLIISDYDNIYVLNLETFSIELKIKDKYYTTDVVSFLQLKNSIVVASYCGNGLLLFKINKNNYSIEHRIESISEEVKHNIANMMLCHIDENSFAACLQENIAIINANEPYDILFLLEGHVTTIGGIVKIKNENLLISGTQCRASLDYEDFIHDELEEETIRIWDLNQKKCVKILYGIDCFSRQIIQFDERIVVIGGFGKIILIDFIKLTIEGIIEDIRIKEHYILSLLKVSDDFILYGNEPDNEYDSRDCHLGIINMKTRKIQEIKNGIEYRSIISMIYINDNTIAIGGHSSIHLIQIK